MGRYAMTYAEASTFPQTVTLTPTQLGYISAYSVADGAEAVPGYNSLRVKVPGTYLVTANIGVTTDTADNFYLSVYKNGVTTGFRNGALVSTDGIGQIIVHAILELDKNDILELYINSGTDASFSVTVAGAQFSMVAV